MDSQGNAYTIGYAVVMTAIVAVTLSFVSTGLKDRQEANQRLAAKIDILKAVGFEDIEKTEAATLFDERVESVVLNAQMQPAADTTAAVDIDMFREIKEPAADRRYPLYIYRHDGETRYIIPMYGNGLWDKIWGYVALKEDMATVAGITMDHKAETPGLGAEIKDNPSRYNKPFEGMSIYNEGGEYVSISMKKGKLDDPAHQIDAITGATITSDGVTEMLYEGIQYYLPYLQQNQNAR